LTHCGSGSFSLAENKNDIVLSPVRLMNRGVCALFPAKTGPVTLVSLDPRSGGYRCSVLEGEAVRTDMVFPGNPVRVIFKNDTKDIIDWIFNEGIGHHWMIGYGHVANEIRMWGKIVGEALTINEMS
jgi:L-arabinose isomerase